MSRAPLSDRALVLRRHPFGESSLVAQVLTERHGRVHLLAKGAHRPSSGYFAVLDLFDTLELEWSPALEGALCLLRRGRVARRRRRLSADLERYACAVESLELAELGSREGERDPAQFALLEGSLERLEAGGSDPAVERIVFDLCFLQNLGLAPRLTACAACGAAEPPPINRRRGRAAGVRVAFSAGAGGRLCPRCALEAAASGRRVDYPMEELLRVAHSLSAADPARLGTIRVDARLAARVRAFLDGFLEYHLEARPRSRRAAVVG